MRERTLLVAIAVLSVAIVIGSFAIGAGLRNRNATHNNTIAVTGSAKKLIESDYVIWDASVSSQQPTAAAAAAQLVGWMATVRSFLHAQGVLDSELNVQPVTAQSVQKATAYGGNGPIIAYDLTASIEVRSTRVAAIAAVAGDSSKLLAEGIPIESQPLQYIFTKLSSVRLALIAAATKDALARAKVLVQATGSHLGNLRTVDVGVFQVTSPNSTAVSGYGEYDTSTIQKQVTAVVNVTFALK
jgi:hypothetical protein